MEGRERLIIADMMARVWESISEYCGVDCDHPWACDQCDLFEVKKILKRCEFGVNLPQYLDVMATEEPSELHVIKGGRE